MPSGNRIVRTAGTLLFEQLEGATGDILLTSPFLSFNVCERLASIAAASQASWRLVTVKNADAVNSGSLNVPGLRRLLNAGVSIDHVDRLHAKAFLVGDEFGLVGSANLTAAGLGSAPNPNAELGVKLGVDEVAIARALILGWDRSPVSPADLDELEEEARRLAKPPRAAKPTKTSMTSVDQLLADARDGKRALWVKAEHGQRALDRWRTESWFASPGPSKRPRFKPGDLALIYAQGIHACYAVVEVIDEPTFDPGFLVKEGSSAPDAARWPWISRTIPRLVPDSTVDITAEEIGVSAQALQNGAVHVALAGFSAGVRKLQEGTAAASGGAE